MRVTQEAGKRQADLEKVELQLNVLGDSLTKLGDGFREKVQELEKFFLTRENAQ